MPDSRPFSSQALAAAVALGVIILGVIWFVAAKIISAAAAFMIGFVIAFMCGIRSYQWMLRINADRRISDGKLDR